MLVRARQVLVASLVVVGVMGAGSAVPAAADAPDINYFQDITGPDVAVKGDYIPVVGHFTDLVLDDILWYAPGSGKESLWTPCPGCDKGPFTKKTLPLAQQVTSFFQPIVGDFSGDGLDDIFWWSSTGPDYLFTNNGSGNFTSRLTQMADGPWNPVVLPDSRSGDGKDDILWSAGQERTSPLWVFPDNGSGAVKTAARLRVPEGEPIVGDFDGNGAADILFYPHLTGCRCEEPSPATSIDTLWRRATSTAPGFTATTMNIKGNYLPLVGRFSGQGDERDDILWVGQTIDPGGSSTDGPDSLWEGRATGAFTASSQSIPSRGGAIVLGHDVADTALVFDESGTNVWFDTTSGPVVRPIGNDLPNSFVPFVGRFTTADRADLFAYFPGTRAEHIYHPIF